MWTLYRPNRWWAQGHRGSEPSWSGDDQWARPAHRARSNRGAHAGPGHAEKVRRMTRALVPRLLGHLPSSLKQAGVLISNYRGLRRSLVRRYIFNAFESVTPSVAVETNGTW